VVYTSLPDALLWWISLEVRIFMTNRRNKIMPKSNVESALISGLTRLRVIA
jgi:hypothetical protein